MNPKGYPEDAPPVRQVWYPVPTIEQYIGVADVSVNSSWHPSQGPRRMSAEERKLRFWRRFNIPRNLETK